jgi:hypothetical protein
MQMCLAFAKYLSAHPQITMKQQASAKKHVHVHIARGSMQRVKEVARSRSASALASSSLKPSASMAGRLVRSSADGSVIELQVLRWPNV